MPSDAHLPWIEKYRPKTVDDISHQEQVVRTLKTSIQSGVLPHLLFYGPAGTGKTSTILAVARSLYGDDFRSTQRVMELNASDERGISVVRHKIKKFAQASISTIPNSSLPPFKLIILDEADSMTSDAQSALRRMMEKFSKVSRFCLICNYVSRRCDEYRIIEPVASRCAKFRFKPLEIESIIARLSMISQNENIQCDTESLTTIVETSGGDMRKAINLLQISSQLTSNVTPSVVQEIAGTFPINLMESLWDVIRTNDFDRMKEQVDSILSMGYPILSILHQLLVKVSIETQLNDQQKASISLKIAQVDKHMIDGASESLQLLDVVAFIMRTFACSNVLP